MHLAVAGDVYDGVFSCCLFFSRDDLDGILDLIGSVSEGFHILFHRKAYGTTGNTK